MTPTHVICSTNPPFAYPPPDDKVWDRSLDPLRTLIDGLRDRDSDVRRLVFLVSDTDEDVEWCGRARKMIKGTWPDALVSQQAAGGHLQLAKFVSTELRIALDEKASLAVDLTLGPKDRAAAIYVAASILQPVTILYAERGPDGFKHRVVPPLGDFNEWMKEHGVLLRNYPQELADLPKAVSGPDHHELSQRELVRAITYMLVDSELDDATSVGAGSNLLSLAEPLRDTVWSAVMNEPRPPGSDEDKKLRDREFWDEWHRSAGRAGQALWQLRCMFDHSQPEGAQGRRPDAIAFLDLLSFLNARLQLAQNQDGSDAAEASEALESGLSDVFVIVDGDDVGKRFAERLVTCSGEEDIEKLTDWSHGIQLALFDHMIDLQRRWQASFLAQTGDGFVARFSSVHFDDFRANFSPVLRDRPVTVGVGPTVKDAFLALRLGKARNRGGGLYYSHVDGKESVLWTAPGSLFSSVKEPALPLSVQA